MNARAEAPSVSQKLYITKFDIAVNKFLGSTLGNNLISKEHRKKFENKSLRPPKTLPKPIQNPSQIDVPEKK